MLSSDLLRGARAASEFTGLTERAIYHLVETDRLPVIRKGRSLFFRRSSLEKAFEDVSDVSVATNSA